MKLSKTVLTLLLVAAMLFSTAFGTFAAKKMYVSDVCVETGSTIGIACSALEKKGYTPVEKDLNRESSGMCVVLGYKQTDNPEEAITDLSVMTMEGGYSFSQYEAMLNKQKDGVAKLVDELKTAVSEFRTKYNAGDKAAMFAYGLLNRYTNDDMNDMGIGDMFVSEATTDAQLQMMFLQGNSNLMVAFEYMLYLGLCSNDWVSALPDLEAEGNYGLSIDADARKIFAGIDDFQSNMNQFASFGITSESTDEEIDAFLSEATDNEKCIFEACYDAYTIANETDYLGKTLYEFLMGDKDEMDITEFYPMASVMTEGQLSVIKYVDLARAISYSVADKDSLQEAFDKYVATDETYDANEKTSVYKGVDRSLYDANGIALTNAALVKEQSTGDSSWACAGQMEVLSKVAYAALALCFVSVIALGILKQGKEKFITYFAYKAVQSVEHYYYYDLLAGATAKYTAVFGTAINVLTGITIALLLIMVGISLYSIIIKNTKHPTYSEMPRVMVDETFDKAGNSKYTYYYCARDTSGNLADLNAWDGLKWNALYYTKDTNAGTPLTVNSVVQYGKGNNNLPGNNYRPVHYFSETAAYNLNRYSTFDTTLLDENYIFMFFEGDSTASGTASVFTQYGGFAISAFAGLIVGGVIMFFVGKGRRKKVCMPEEA